MRGWRCSSRSWLPNVGRNPVSAHVEGEKDESREGKEGQVPAAQQSGEVAGPLRWQAEAYGYVVAATPASM